MASVSGVRAATTLTAWTFDNLTVGINSGPTPSSGLGTASALGMNNGYNQTNSVSNPDIQSLAGSSSGGANSWRIRGFNNGPGSHGNGWSTNAPMGTQGAQFTGSTYGYYKIQVSFDVYATADAEANLQVQYSTDGSTWFNANIASAASGVIATNTINASTVKGTYIKLVSGWNNQVTVDLSGLSGADNDTAFAIRIVNASTGGDCVDTTGTVYSNTSGSWTLDNVVIQGSAIDTIADWNFDLVGIKAAPYNTPAPTIGSGSALSLGMTNNYTFSDGSVGSSNWCDILAQGGASTGPNSLCWRVRGGISGAGAPNSGWNSAAPIFSQGAEFDVSTLGYTNIICSFDIYFTTQAPDKFCVLYTTDGWATTNVANSLFFGAKPRYILINETDPNLVIGSYFYETFGQGWYNNIVVDLSGVPEAANNPQFGFRVVNAATGPQYQNFLGQSYNNLSGNWRFDNVTVGGTSGTPPPAIAFDPNATVDNPFTNTYSDNPGWRTNISAIYVNGVALTNTAYTTTNAGEIIYYPAKSALLQASGLLDISIISIGFGTAKVPQPLAAGVATKLAITTQAAGPTASGGTLTANPVFLVSDQYGNGTTNPYASVTISASVGGAGGWTLGGDAQQSSTNGVIAFTNLSANVNGSAPVSGAYLTFSVVGFGATFMTNSTTFKIGAPPVAFTPGNLAVLQVDTLGNNTTFSIIELSPSAARQTAPVNVVPISATGTNALRLSPAGATGRLVLSDDGTLLVFAAFADGSAATPDETLNLNRAAVALNYSNQTTILGTYSSISLGGSEARAACVLDNDTSWIVVDKGGLYEGLSGGQNLAQPNLNNFNNVVVKTFGGVPYVETQKAVAGQSIPEVYALGLDPSTGLYDVTFANNLTTDQYATDFYLISTNGGVSYDVLYIADQVSGTNGVINKFSLVGGNWIANAGFTNSTGIDGLFATTNDNGGVNLFYTTGSGGTQNNSVVRVTDAAGWNQNISITSSNVLYTATGSTSLKGLTFVPQVTANAVQPIPPPVLTAQKGAGVVNTFALTNTPADPAWHSAITGITVNGSTLPPAAYDTTQAGKIVFSPAQSTLLQSLGPKTIVISATGYSTDSIVLALGPGPATQILITTQPAGPLGDGGPLATQPVVTLLDQYTNSVTNVAVIASAAQNTWILGGAVTNTPGSGGTTFTNLTAFSTTAVTDATITFTSGGLTITSSPFNIPSPTESLLGGFAVKGGKFGFSFTNITGLTYSVLASKDVAAPLTNWIVLGKTVEAPPGSGQYQFNDSNSATNSQLFYRLRQP